MKRYVIQSRVHNWDPWKTMPGREYDTMDEAKAAFKEVKASFDALPFKDCYRIAEAYIQVRYKAVKTGAPEPPYRLPTPPPPQKKGEGE